MMYMDAGEAGLAVFASNAGAPANPAGYYNLLANPRATVEVGMETFDVMARVATPEERAPIWETQKQRYPRFGDYERATAREIPVMILKRAE